MSRKFTAVLALCLLSCISGCYRGGGGEHTPPDEIFFGEATDLSFKEVVIGSVGPGVGKIVTGEKVFYRLGADEEYREAKTARKILSDRELLITATIPPLKEGKGTVLEYYYEVKWDGQLNHSGSKDEPHRVPILPHKN